MKIHPVGAKVFNVDGQTDRHRHDEANSFFWNFVNTPKQQHFKVLYLAFWKVFSEPWLIMFKLSESSQTLEEIKYATNIYRVSQEECARLWDSVPYVKLYRYNPKHLYPKSNGYRDNSQRRVWSSSVSTYCTPSVTSYLSNAPARQLDIVMQWPWHVHYSAR